MAYNFSANQFDHGYSAKRLNNWELSKWYPPRPRQRKGSTKVIANDSGHLLPNVKRVDNNPWGNYRNTYQLPEKITRRFGEDYNACLVRRDKWKHFPQETSKAPCADNNNNQLGVAGTGYSADCQPKCGSAGYELRKAGLCTKKPYDFEYIPGDFTAPKDQHSTRDFLLDQKYERDNGIEPELPLDKLYLGDHKLELSKYDDPSAPFKEPLPATLSPQLQNVLSQIPDTTLPDFDSKPPTMTHHTITGKPHERCPSPVVPAYANFELAKRMHQDNLDHQPLPDCVADLAFRKLQLSGGHPGLALELDPIATGIGIKTHNVGPTHCTKMKVYRPQTCGFGPKAYNGDAYRPLSSTDPNKKLGAMDLAICWDYQPNNPADEPQRPRHIDGSNESAGPAVFTCVKTPREDTAVNTGRSAGVFTNTHGEAGFFEKDIMRQKNDFTGRNLERDNNCACGVDAFGSNRPSRAHSVSRQYSGGGHMPSRYGKQYQSSPNVTGELDYKALREKYLGVDDGGCPMGIERGCKRANPGFLRRARSRLCHKVAPEPAFCHKHSYERRMPCKAAFRAGVPKLDAAGHFVSVDSGCSLGSNNASRVLVVPRPRNPYAKRNYDIDTLVPPFQSYGGGAGQGGYPEHWRLASVYQHAYKPPEHRRRSLLQTVYK